jgi:hypothetical protein
MRNLTNIEWQISAATVVDIGIRGLMESVLSDQSGMFLDCRFNGVPVTNSRRRGEVEMLIAAMTWSEVAVAIAGIIGFCVIAKLIL